MIMLHFASNIDTAVRHPFGHGLLELVRACEEVVHVCSCIVETVETIDAQKSKNKCNCVHVSMLLISLCMRWLNVSSGILVYQL